MSDVNKLVVKTDEGVGWIFDCFGRRGYVVGTGGSIIYSEDVHFWLDCRGVGRDGWTNYQYFRHISGNLDLRCVLIVLEGVVEAGDHSSTGIGVNKDLSSCYIPCGNND